MKTGDADLQGGDDNVHLVVLLPDGRPIRFENVNEGRRWVNKSVNEAARELPADLRVEDVVGVRLATTFGDGI